MKKIVSLFAAIVMTVGIMSAMPLTVNAASKSSSDGLDVSMETSTNSYALNEDEQNIATEVEINVSVKNTNATDFTDVEVKLELPSGLMLKTGDLVESGISVPSGKTHKFTATAIHFKPSSGGNDDNKPTNEDDNPTNSDDSNEKANTNDTSNDIDSPKTGDSFSLASVLVVMLFSASFILVAIRRGMRIPKGVISLGLCLAIVAGAANITVFAAESSTDVKTITVDQTVNISVKNGEESFVIKATISYTKPDTQPAIPLNGEDHLYSPNVENVATDEETGIMYMNNMIIVVFSDNATDEQITGLVAQIDGKVVGKIGSINQYQIQISQRTLPELQNLITDIETNEFVLFAHYDGVCENPADEISINDPWNGDVDNTDWNDNDVDGSNWWLEAVNVPKVWKYNELYNGVSTGYFSKINIGIVDNGFDTNHKDLKVSFANGYKANNRAADHGTHVAGIIGAKEKNKKGITGIVWNKELLCFDWQPDWLQGVVHQKILKNWSTDTMIYAGLTYTVDSGAKVINFSIGKSGGLKNNNHVYSQNAIDEEGRTASAYMAQLLKRHDFVVVQSAGNGAKDGIGVDAKYNGHFCSVTNNNCWSYGSGRASKQGILDRIIVVAAAQRDDWGGYMFTSFSNGGSQVDIAAPGLSVYSTLNGSKYGNMSGTSMAAPIVTGIASLVWSVNPNFSGDQVRNMVCGIGNTSVNCVDNGNSPNATGTVRMVNAELAVRAAIDSTVVIEEPEDARGTLSGKVCKATDRETPIPNAVINVYEQSRLVKTATSNESGNYSIVLPVGDYKVKITAEGYMDFEAYAKIKKDETNYMETFLMVAESEATSGVAKGKVTNTLVGSGVEGVTLTFKPYWNNTAGTGDTVGTAVTDANGYYTAELPLGNYTAIATKSGFLESTFNIVVQEGTTDNQNGTITPIVSGDDFRITLTWGENPRDLDSHVEGTLSSGSHFHVYFSHKSQYDGDIEVCNLDYDDTTSYGPEHITLKTTSDKPYYYYIHRWAGSGTISSSSAKIQIHQGSTLIKEFNVPTSLGSGDYWNVFAIVNGRLVVRNTMTSSPETSYINADGSMVRGASTQNLQGSSDNMTSKETTSDEVSADSQTDAVSSSVESSAPESTEATVVSSEPASVSTEDVTSATEESSTEEYPISSSEDTAPATPKTQNQTATVPAQKEEADDVSPSDANN